MKADAARPSNQAARRRLAKADRELERRRIRLRNGMARAFVAGTTLGDLVVLGVVDGKTGGRMANVAYTPGEALRYAWAIVWRALIACWER